MSADPRFLRHPLLDQRGVAHGFGLRGATAPEGMVRVRQVHGADVVRVRAGRPAAVTEADAIVSDAPGIPVGVFTADCVPVLLATAGGETVAAVHAGWRGLARGVVAAAVAALADVAADPSETVAVVGPHVRPCCYEIDAPVVDALGERLRDALPAALREVRPGRWRLDLGELARFELERAGLARRRLAAIAGACTACDAARFHSYRREGPSAGRLVHFVAARKRGLDSPERSV